MGWEGGDKLGYKAPLIASPARRRTALMWGGGAEHARLTSESTEVLVDECDDSDTDQMKRDGDKRRHRGRFNENSCPIEKTKRRPRRTTDRA